MVLSDYGFGKIKVDGKSLKSDFKIFNGKIIENWWRKEGHKLYLEDIPEIHEKPLKLIVGKGYFSMMKIDDQVIRFCEENGIELIAEKSKKAVEIFNEEKEKEKVLFCIHLTC